MNKFEYGIFISAVIGMDKYKRSKEVKEVKVSDDVFFTRLKKYLLILYTIFELKKGLPANPSEIEDGPSYVQVKKDFNFRSVSKAKNLDEYLETISKIFECSKEFFDVQTNMGSARRVLAELQYDFLVYKISGPYGVLYYRLLFSDFMCISGKPTTNIQKASRFSNRKSPDIIESVVQCYVLMDEETYESMGFSPYPKNPTFIFNKDDMSNALGVPREIVPSPIFVNCNNEGLNFILLKNKKIFSEVLNGEGICRNFNCSSIKHFCPSSAVKSILKIQRKFTQSAEFTELERISEERLLSIMDIIENLSQSPECFTATLTKTRSRSKSVPSRSKSVPSRATSVPSRATSVYKAPSRVRSVSSRAKSKSRSRSPSIYRKSRSPSPVPIGSQALI